jgi:hypothetical protein
LTEVKVRFEKVRKERKCIRNEKGREGLKKVRKEKEVFKKVRKEKKYIRK